MTTPIIALYDPKDLVITILSLIIIIKILLVLAYYKGVSDTRKTINGFTSSDIADYKKFQGK